MKKNGGQIAPYFLPAGNEMWLKATGSPCQSCLADRDLKTRSIDSRPLAPDRASELLSDFISIQRRWLLNSMLAVATMILLRSLPVA